MQKTLAVGQRLRIRGEIKGGFSGWTMLHPTARLAGGELPSALTPVYPTVAGLPQAYLRKAVLGGLARAELSDTFAPGDLSPLNPQAHGGLWTLHEALAFLHHPRPDVAIDTLMDHSHPAWQRLKAEELLAQQLSQLQARRARAALRAPVLQPDASPGALRQRLHGALPFALTGAQARVSFSSSGLARARSASLAPTSPKSWPPCAAGTVPSTGQSMIEAPLAASTGARSRTVCGRRVLISMKSLPFRSASPKPPSMEKRPRTPSARRMPRAASSAGELGSAG
jgi:hypothetical protein